MGCTNHRLMLFQIFAMLLALLLLGCVGEGATDTSIKSGALSPWAPYNSSQPGIVRGPTLGTDAILVPPVPYNFSKNEIGNQNASLSPKPAGNVSAGLPDLAAQSFFDTLALKSGANVTFSELTSHSIMSSCWTVIHGNVFDMTGWVNTYPPGISGILSTCALDGTEFYDKEFIRYVPNSTRELEKIYKGVYVG